MPEAAGGGTPSEVPSGRPDALPRPAAVLFDAGGTLVQVRTDLLAAQLHARGVEPGDLDEALWRTLVLAETRFGPDVGGHDDWWDDWLAHWAEGSGVDAEGNPWCQLLPGVTECLSRLRDAGVRLGVVSNADGRVAEALGRAGLAGFFEVIVDSTLVGVAKPDPAIFDVALDALGAPRERTWYIGDTVAYDAAAADAAGLVSWVIDHRGLHTVPHPRRIGSLAELADAALA